MSERSGVPLFAGSPEGDGLALTKSGSGDWYGFGRDDDAWLETGGGRVGATMTR